MKSFILFLVIGGLSVVLTYGQTLAIQGNVTEALTNQPIEGVRIWIEGSTWSTLSGTDGLFMLKGNQLPLGEVILATEREGYIGQRIFIIVSENSSNNKIPIRLQLDLNSLETALGVLELGAEELGDQVGFSESTPGLLQANSDVFFKAAAYNFSAAFFRPRGLGSEHSQVAINGMAMNQMESGRPLWSMWGGLNDAQRNRVFSMGLQANDYSFGNLGANTNFIMKASQFRKGGQVSFASSNRTYLGRLMASYNSGRTLSGWAYSILLSHRFGASGYKEGTFYDAPSYFFSVEKELDEKQSVNLTVFHTPNERGKSSALTQEVLERKGNRYNPYWGLQEGKVRNSRTSSVSIPVFMLNHDWKLSEQSELHNSIMFQKGFQGETRLDHGGFRNPYPNYYQRLPSYFLRNPTPLAYDYQLAYLAGNALQADGQLDWNSLYSTNEFKSSGNPGYVLYEDVTRLQQFALNSNFQARIGERGSFSASLDYRKSISEHYALTKDLLGGTSFRDIDSFYQGNDANFEFNDVLHPDRLVGLGDKFKYNYNVNSQEIAGFGQFQYQGASWNAFFAAEVKLHQFQRIGNFQNGYFQEEGRSLGNSEKVIFNPVGFKGGLTYRLNGRHFFEINLGYRTKAPLLKNIFPNIRISNDLVDKIKVERIKTVDASYLFRTSRIKSRLTAYYNHFQDQTDIGFFFTQNAIGAEDNTAFVQEVLQGIDKLQFGIELGFEFQVMPSLSLNTAASFGQFYYSNNPSLYLSGDDFDVTLNDGYVEGSDLASRGKRKVYLKNVHVSAGPEQAFQLGVDYRDPDYWWVGISANYLSNAYVDVSALKRSEDFALEEDGVAFAQYNVQDARSLLRQESLGNYFLLNLVGGKSWRLERHYLGFFLTLNNAFNQTFKTGGFEDSRRANFLQQLEEQNRPGGPLFGTRYFTGNGTTYFLNCYIRF